MSVTTRTSGTTVQEALRRAFADLLRIDDEQVELRLEAPGLDRLNGEVRIELAVGPGESSESAATEAVDREGDADREADGTATEGDRAAEGSDTDEEGPGGRPAAPVTIEELEEEADAAADFLEGLLDALDLPGDLRIRIHDDHAEIEVVEIGSGALIGRRGQTLESIQELVRCTLQRQFQRRARVKVDAEGYRSRRLEKLLEKAEEAIDQVLESGEPERLEPMDVFERKAVHHLVAEVDGLTSRSQGREPARRIVIERG